MNGGHITLQKVNLVIEMRWHKSMRHFSLLSCLGDVQMLFSTVRNVSGVEAMFHGPNEAEKASWEPMRKSQAKGVLILSLLTLVSLRCSKSCKKTCFQFPLSQRSCPSSILLFHGKCCFAFD